MLSVSVQEAESEIDEFIAKYGLGYQFLMDRTGQIAADYEIASTPTTFFIRPDGTIADSTAGVVSAGWLETNLDDYITT